MLVDSIQVDGVTVISASRCFYNTVVAIEAHTGRMLAAYRKTHLFGAAEKAATEVQARFRVLLARSRHCKLQREE